MHKACELYLFTMKIKFTPVLLLSVISLPSFCQVTEAEKSLQSQNADTAEGWKKGAVISLNLTQTSLTNWAAGGQNSIAGNGLISLSANYRKNKGIWENLIDIGYGSIKQGKNAPWWKTDDKFDLTSRYGRKMSGNWYYAALLNFKTQMTPGYNYPNDSLKISDFLAPGYLITAIGLNYTPDTNFTLFVAPLTAKTTFVNDRKLADAGAFGVDPAEYDASGKLISNGETMRTEYGSFLRMFYRKNLMENILFQTKLDLFSNYLNNPQNMDVSWEVLLAMKVNKYFTANVTTHLLYDDDIDIAIDSNNDGIAEKASPRTQFKEILAVGFSYKF